MFKFSGKIVRSLSVVLLLAITGCATQQMGSRSSVVDYLYPKKQQVAIEPGIAQLPLPLRVGIAFVPTDRLHRRGANPWAWADHGANSLTEKEKLQIMDRLASHFRQQDFIGDIQLIPSAYMRPQGSFDNLDQLKSMFGIDVIALISFDQMQFSDESKKALSYWTLVGAYLVSGQKNDTYTLLDTAVYDISSRKMLFRAPGSSQVKGRSTPINLNEELRADSKRSFDVAAEQMVQNLELELVNFKQRLKQQPADIQLSRRAGYSGGSGGTVLLILLISCFLWRLRCNR